MKMDQLRLKTYSRIQFCTIYLESGNIGGSSLWAKYPRWELSGGGGGAIALGGNCPRGHYLGGNCPGSNYPGKIALPPFPTKP